MNRPELVAQFLLDEHGHPKAIDRGGHKHYWIVLRVTGAPENTYAVNYHLHETYYEPVRESRERTDGFAAQLTSYGDYTVQAQVRTANRVETLAESLSRALERGHGGEATPQIQQALKDVREH